MAGPLDLWTKIKDSQILHMTLHKRLDIGPLDQNLKFTDYIKCLFIKGWTIGPLDQNQTFSDSIN